MHGFYVTDDLETNRAYRDVLKAQLDTVANLAQQDGDGGGILKVRRCKQADTGDARDRSVFGLQPCTTEVRLHIFAMPARTCAVGLHGAVAAVPLVHPRVEEQILLHHGQLGVE